MYLAFLFNLKLNITNSILDLKQVFQTFYRHILMLRCFFKCLSINLIKGLYSSRKYWTYSRNLSFNKYNIKCQLPCFQLNGDSNSQFYEILEVFFIEKENKLSAVFSVLYIIIP